MDHRTANAYSRRNKKRETNTNKLENGAVIDIYKNKGDEKDCGNHRPISLLQIAYKIWHNLTTKRLANILQIVTSNNQYGYKRNVSAIDEIVKIEQYIAGSSQPRTYY